MRRKNQVALLTLTGVLVLGAGQGAAEEKRRGKVEEPPRKLSFLGPALFYTGLGVGDVITSKRAFDAGAVEQNILFRTEDGKKYAPSLKQLVLVKAGITGVSYLLDLAMQHAKRNGGKRWQLWAYRVLQGAAHGFFMGWNERVRAKELEKKQERANR